MVEGIEPYSQDVPSPEGGMSPTLTASANTGLLLLLFKVSNMIGRSVFWGFGLVLTAIVSATIGATLAFMTPLSFPAGSEPSDTTSLQELWQENFQYRMTRPVNILVMGIDHLSTLERKKSTDLFAGNSDTMLLIRVNPKDNSVSVLSIPRDTQVDIPGIGLDKINDANVKGGPTLAASIVSRTLNDVTIDRYVRVSTGAFRELVDLLGGVEVFVPQPMQYTDETQKLKIDLAQGWQTLNGEQAEQFARFRNDGQGDIGRVQRQQMLLKSLRGRLTSPSVLPRLPQIIQVLEKYIDTNLSVEEMLALASFGLQLEPENLKMVMLPGRFSTLQEFAASYWLLDPEGRDRIMRDYFQVASPQKIAQAQPLRPRTNLRVSNPIRIAIQNATESPEIASRVAQTLQKQGFENVFFVEDWPDQLIQTQIIVQKGDLEAANQVKNILGLGQVEPISTGDITSDITIRLGKDWLNTGTNSTPSTDAP